MVGAILYRDGAYVGHAAPVVLREEHSTRVTYLAGNDAHTSHDLYSATSRQVAVTAGPLFARVSPT